MKQNENTLDHIKTHADAVIHFIKNLDIDMVDDLLDEKYTYQDLKKNIFIQQFSVAFDEFIAAGDRQLEVSNGFCNEVICKCNMSNTDDAPFKPQLYPWDVK